jgi:hypothetical protein
MVHSTTEEIFCKINEFIIANEIEWTKCVGVSTDGARAMLGKFIGLITRIKKNHTISHMPSLLHSWRSYSFQKNTNTIENSFGRSCKNCKLYKIKITEFENFLTTLQRHRY